MGKKNIFIGLSTLLLVLLLGLSTHTYANDVSLDDFKNFCVNLGILRGMSQTDVESWVDNSSAFSDFETWVSGVLESDSYDVFICSSGYNVYFYYSAHSSNNKIVVTNTTNINISISMGNYKGFQMRVNDSSFTNSYQANSQNTFNNLVNNYFYSGVNMYNGWGSVIWESAPVYYTSSDIFDGPYSIPPRPQPYIEPYPYYDLGSIVIYNATLPAYEFTTTGLHDQGLTKMRFATAYNPTDYKIVHYGIGYYNYVKPYDRWDLETLVNSATNWHGFENWQIRGNAIVGFNSSLNSETNYWETLITINNKYVHANCAYVIELECIPLEDTVSGDTANTVFLYLPMYLTDSHTVIDSNGELDTDNTFTNDYYLDYRTDIEDLNKQINDITGITDVINSEITDVPPVDDMLAYGLFSGDMYYLAGNLGYVNRSNHYWDFLYLYTYNLCQVLLQDSDPYFDFRLHGEETAYRIYSHDIGLPDGHPLKVFVSLFFLFGFIWIIYYQFKSIVEAIQTANMPKVAHLEDADLYFFKM